MRKISWPWPECNQFQRWSGYINMSNFRPFLPCVLKINIPWSKSNLFWGWPEYTNMPNLRPFSVVFSRKCPEIAKSKCRNVAKMRKINRRWPKSKSVLKMFRIHQYVESWRRHQMETYSALLALCVGDSLVTGEFPSQRPVTLSFDVFFDLRPNKRFSKQSWGWWFETPSRSLWHYCNDPAIQRDCNKM